MFTSSKEVRENEKKVGKVFTEIHKVDFNCYEPAERGILVEAWTAILRAAQSVRNRGTYLNPELNLLEWAYDSFAQLVKVLGGEDSGDPKTLLEEVKMRCGAL